MVDRFYRGAVHSRVPGSFTRLLGRALFSNEWESLSKEFSLNATFLDKSSSVCVSNAIVEFYAKRVNIASVAILEKAHVLQAASADPRGIPWCGDGVAMTLLAKPGSNQYSNTFQSGALVLKVTHSLNVRSLSEFERSRYRDLRSSCTPDFGGTLVPLLVERVSFAWPLFSLLALRDCLSDADIGAGRS